MSMFAFHSLFAAAMVALPVSATVPAVAATPVAATATVAQATGHADLVSDLRSVVLSARMSVGDSSGRPDFASVNTAEVKELANDGYTFEDGRIGLAALPAGWQVVPARQDARGHAAAFRVVANGVPSAACRALVDGLKDVVGRGEVVVGDLASRGDAKDADRLCGGLKGTTLNRFSVVVE